MRLFIALPLPDEVETLLGKLIADFRQKSGNVKWVPPENVHLTLKFLGDTDDGLAGPLEELMASSVEGIAPFRMTFEGVGAFPNSRKPRVVWIGLVGAEPLTTISRRLEQGVVALGFKREKRAFRPHATVARIKYVGHASRLASLLDRWADASFGSMEVGAIHLKRSQLTPEGAIHSTVHSTNLEG